MADSRPAHCCCPRCRQGADPSEGNYHREMRAFLSTLSNEQRRLFAAVEANHLGRGGVRRISEITELCPATIASGRRQLADLLEGHPLKKRHNPGGGRKRTEQKYPEISAALEEMLNDEIAGSPEGDARWVRSSCRKLAEQLKEKGFLMSYRTVWLMLRRMGFSISTVSGGLIRHNSI